MLSRPNFRAGVFIGGMDGIEAEYEIFTKYHPRAPTIILGVPGGAALDLAKSKVMPNEDELNSVDFAGIFFRGLHPKEN